MASLRARHARSCALKGAETKEPDHGTSKVPGCTCNPTYSIRRHLGKNKYETRPLEGDAKRQLKKARVALNRFQEDVERGAAVSIDRTRFQEWGEEWLRIVGSRDRSPATIAEYEVTLRYANEHFRDKYVHEIRPQHVEAFRRSLHKLSPTTRNKHMRNLRVCFTKAVEQEVCSRSPVPREKEVEIATRGSFFTRDEIAKVAKHVPEGVHRVLFLTALRTGLRASELIMLRWVNVDTDAGVIRVRESMSRGQAWRPKSKTSDREVYVDPGTAAVLKAWKKKNHSADDERVFLRPDGKQVTLEDATKRVLYPAMKKAGVPREDPEGVKRVFHSLRDTYASTVLGAGKSMYWLSVQLGHSSIQITEQRYAHLDRAVRAEQAADLGDAFAA